MQNEEISKETVGEWGDYLPYMVTGHWEPSGRNRAKREQSMRRQQEGIMVGRR